MFVWVSVWRWQPVILQYFRRGILWDRLHGTSMRLRCSIQMVHGSDGFRWANVCPKRVIHWHVQVHVGRVFLVLRTVWVCCWNILVFVVRYLCIWRKVSSGGTRLQRPQCVDAVNLMTPYTELSFSDTRPERTGKRSHVYADSVESNTPTESGKKWVLFFCFSQTWTKPLVEESEVDGKMEAVE